MFHEIITTLHALKREFINAKKVKKFWNYFLESWDAKITTIFESKYLTIYSIDQFRSSFIAHDQKILQRNIYA